MERAFVLINCDLGSEKSLIGILKNLPNVKGVQGVFGAYDILATIESDKPETIRETVVENIRKLNHVQSTLTLIGIESLNPESTLAEIIPDIIPEEKRFADYQEDSVEDEEELEDDYEDEEYSKKK